MRGSRIALGAGMSGEWFARANRPVTTSPSGSGGTGWTEVWSESAHDNSVNVPKVDRPVAVGVGLSHHPGCFVRSEAAVVIFVRRHNDMEARRPAATVNSHGSRWGSPATASRRPIRE